MKIQISNMDAKTTEYYLYCGIKTGWHEKSLSDFTNDEEALEAVKKYLSTASDVVTEGIGIYLWGLSINCVFVLFDCFNPQFIVYIS